MARKIKIPNHLQKRLVRVNTKRKINVRTKRKFYLIVCEGVQTEPNYFEAIKERLPKGVLTACHIEIEGAGRNTESLLDETIRLMGKWHEETGRPIDKAWVVFDRDSFEAQQFNTAITRCKQSKPEIGCAWSNEAFELWYLLHLIYFDTAIRRTEYQRMLEEQLSKKMGKAFVYTKNSKEMLDILSKYGNLDFAIENAERLEKLWEEREDYANQKPCTKVHHLINELRLLKKTFQKN
ncbi:MAG: RloB domain-containing protein [Chitinophagaceae bacterium]|nr:RloB domain-containing protein [Chitinophagaceae bacterium]